MEIILIIAVYILVCVLAYGRVMASLFETVWGSGEYPVIFIVTCLSWAGFATGLLMYWFDEEQTFFKFK